MKIFTDKKIKEIKRLIHQIEFGSTMMGMLSEELHNYSIEHSKESEKRLQDEIRKEHISIIDAKTRLMDLGVI